MNVTDEIREIVVKYKQSSDIILLGDMNASMFRDPSLPRDKYLKVVLNEMNLSLPVNYPEVYTWPIDTVLANQSLTILFKTSQDL